MSARQSYRPRERSWERDDRDRGHDRGSRSSRGGRGGRGYRESGRRRDSRSRSPPRDKAQRGSSGAYELIHYFSGLFAHLSITDRRDYDRKDYRRDDRRDRRDDTRSDRKDYDREDSRDRDRDKRKDDPREDRPRGASSRLEKERTVEKDTRDRSPRHGMSFMLCLCMCIKLIWSLQSLLPDRTSIPTHPMMSVKKVKRWMLPTRMILP